MTAVDAVSPSPHGPKLSRRLGLGLLTLYGVGVMVGAGVYVLIGEVAALAGGLTPWAFVLAGVAAGLTAASFAELTARIPEAGGEAAYARAAFGWPALSVLVGFAVALVGVFSAGVVLQGGVGYLQALVPAPAWALILALGMMLTGLAVWGVVESLAAAAVLTAVEVAGLLVIVAVALWADPVTTQVEPPVLNGGNAALAGLSGAVFLAFFAFIGFEDMVNMAEETRDPSRTVPRAILFAFVAVTAIYVLVAYAAVRVADPAALAESPRPLALVYETATGQNAWFIAGVGAAAALNGVLAQIVMAARVLFGLGGRNPALAPLAMTHPRFRTPWLATLLVGAVVILLALTTPLEHLASATSMVLLMVFMLMNTALIVLKRRGPPPEGAPDLPIWLPYAGFAASLMVAVGALV